VRLRQAVAFLAVGFHNGFEPVAVQILVSVDIELQLHGFGDQVVARELALGDEDQVVHLQKLAFARWRRAQLHGPTRFLVHRQWVVLEGEANLAWGTRQQLMDDWRGFAQKGHSKSRFDKATAAVADPRIGACPVDRLRRSRGDDFALDALTLWDAG